MRINIKQNKISLTSTYKVFIEGENKYLASAKLFRIFSEIPIIELSSNEIKLTIKKRFFLFKPKYDFYRGNEILTFRNIEFWRGHYQCIDSNSTYHIYANKGLKFSVFRNGIQIAKWYKNDFAILAGDEYDIWANNNSDFELIIAFCITIDNHTSKNRNHSLFRVDLGRPGLVKKEFDTDWEPS